MSAKLTVYVYTSDLERLRRFYEGGLGVAPAAQHGNWLPFDLAGATFALHADRGDPSLDRQRVRLSFEVDDIEAAVARFEAAGATVLRGIADEAFGKRALLEDPEGRQIELVMQEMA